MLGMDHNNPIGTYKAKSLETDEIVCRQDVTWHPPNDEEKSFEIGQGGDNTGGFK